MKFSFPALTAVDVLGLRFDGFLHIQKMNSKMLITLMPVKRPIVPPRSQKYSLKLAKGIVKHK